MNNPTGITAPAEIPASVGGADEYEAFAVEAIKDSEHADESSTRAELVARAQAWAMLRVGDVLERLVEVLAVRGGR